MASRYRNKKKKAKARKRRFFERCKLLLQEFFKGVSTIGAISPFVINIVPLEGTGDKPIIEVDTVEELPFK